MARACDSRRERTLARARGPGSPRAGVRGRAFLVFAEMALDLSSRANAGREMLASESGAGCDELGGRALEDDPAAVVAGTGAKVDDPVGVRHDGLVVLDDDDRLAGVDEPVEQAEQVDDVREAEAACGSGRAARCTSPGCCVAKRGSGSGRRPPRCRGETPSRFAVARTPDRSGREHDAAARDRAGAALRRAYWSPARTRTRA